MERKKLKTTSIHYDRNQEPIILSKILLDKLLKQDNPSDLIALYSFYYYTAKWQKTNQPKATDNYCMNGLKIGYDRFRKAKNKLLELGLIEKLQIRIDNKIFEWIIKINFIWKDATYKNSENLELGKPRTRKTKINALSTNNKNALSTNTPREKIPPKTPSIKERNKTYIPLAVLLSKIVQTNKNIKHTHSIITNWTNCFRQVKENMGVDYKRMKQSLNWYKEHINDKYCPVIESGQSFKDKFSKLEDAMKRDQNKYKPVQESKDDYSEKAERSDVPDEIKKLHNVSN